MSDLNNYINGVCKILNINAPEIIIKDKLITDTTLAAYYNGKIYLKSNKVDFDVLFAIAHELRHKWQIETDKEKYFSDYKEPGFVSVEEYNLQIAEIDANAFAGVIMVNNFHVKPLFNGLSVSVKEKIYEYMNKL